MESGAGTNRPSNNREGSQVDTAPTLPLFGKKESRTWAIYPDLSRPELTAPTVPTKSLSPLGGHLFRSSSAAVPHVGSRSKRRTRNSGWRLPSRTRVGSHQRKKHHAGPEQRGKSKQEGPPGAATDIPQGVPVLLPRAESLTHATVLRHFEMNTNTPYGIHCR